MGGRGGLPGGRGRVPLARAARGDGKGANRGRSRVVWSGRGHAARTGGLAGVRPGHRQGAGRREVEEAVSGSSVIFSKFKNPVM